MNNFPTGTCTRCGRHTGCTTMSRFNTQEICMECEEIEKRHPAYKEAADAELAACKGGDYNFPGVGLPAGFHEWAKKQEASNVSAGVHQGD